MFEAIRQFQEDNKLPVTGAIRPHDETMEAINREIEDQPIATEYIWRSVQDDKVRSSHAARNGKRFTWLQHPVPGEEHNCRCWAEPVPQGYSDKQLQTPGIDKIQRMPDWEIEVLAASLVGKVAIGNVRALKAIEWATKNTVSNEVLPWHLSQHKTGVRWVNRAIAGDWFNGGFKKNVDLVLSKGEKFSAPNKVNKGNTATRFHYQDKFLVRDDKTGAILQLSRKNIKPEELP